MEIGLVRSIDIDREMQQAYLDYAMSVIVARALPDARDGLKPVHRRILYAMYDMGMRPDTPYKKSARIVGEVLGKYHPHGDMTVYEAMARMAQLFSMRTVLVDGQGNFGSVDGDPPAAMRYTEARLAPPAMNMLLDIQKNTVDFSPNFDGSLQEPIVLPAALPNMLVNGATGIAVGMSTSIPPHNLGEVVDALVFMLENWNRLDDINVEDLMQFIKGPDFPTGGIIVLSDNEEEGLTSAYGSGRGRITVQARAHFEEMSRGRNRIIVTELPYMTNKASLIERIAELVRDERIDGVADLRDESDRQGLRIVIELNKTADPAVVLQSLYKSTSMRSTFGIIMLALVDGEPRMLSLKQVLRVYLDHRQVVIRRRGEHDLERAKQRAHILEGLRIALKFLDEVIAIIRKAPDAETARSRLIKRFKLTDIQAQAILDMQLRRLAALERRKIEDEYKEVKALIKELESLLRSPKKMREVVAEELLVVKEAFSDRRRTQIVQRNGGGDLSLVAGTTSVQQVWVSVTSNGLISRSPEDAMPGFSGRDAPVWQARVNSRDTLYLVSEQGDAAGIPMHAIPETADPAAGAPLYKVSALDERDRLAALFTLPPKEERPEGTFVLSATRGGNVKKTAASELPGATARTISLMKVNEGDGLGWALLTGGKSELVMVTGRGLAIRFSEEEVRPMGLGAAGVGGIKLQVGDEVIGLAAAPEKGELLLVASDGKAKRVPSDQFPVQGRYGQGVVAWKLAGAARLVGAAAVPAGIIAHRLLLHLDRLEPRQVKPQDAPLQTRAASGKAIVSLKGADRVIRLTEAIDLGEPRGGELVQGGDGKPGGGGKSRPSKASPVTLKRTAPKKESPVGKTNGGETKSRGKAGTDGKLSASGKASARARKEPDAKKTKTSTKMQAGPDGGGGRKPSGKRATTSPGAAAPKGAGQTTSSSRKRSAKGSGASSEITQLSFNTASAVKAPPVKKTKAAPSKPPAGEVETGKREKASSRTPKSGSASGPGMQKPGAGSKEKTPTKTRPASGKQEERTPKKADRKSTKSAAPGEKDPKQGLKKGGKPGMPAEQPARRSKKK